MSEPRVARARTIPSNKTDVRYAVGRVVGITAEPRQTAVARRAPSVLAHPSVRVVKPYRPSFSCKRAVVVLTCVDAGNDRRVLGRLNGAVRRYQIAVPVSPVFSVVRRVATRRSPPAVAQEGAYPRAGGRSLLTRCGADPPKGGRNNPVRLPQKARVSLSR